MIVKVRFFGSSIPLRFSSACKGCVIGSRLTPATILLQESEFDDVLSVVDYSWTKRSVIHGSENHLFDDVTNVTFFDNASDLRTIAAHTMIHLEDL